MSKKTSGTKAVKRTRVLEARQKFYDNYLEKFTGYKRPGGTPSKEASTNPKVVFIKDDGGEQKALGRIRDLGFGDLLVGTKMILVKGAGSLGFWKCADFLVNFCGYKFVTSEN